MNSISLPSVTGSRTSRDGGPVVVRAISEGEVEEFVPLTFAYRDWYQAHPISHAQNADFFRKFLQPSQHGLWLGAKVNNEPVGFATIYWTHSSLAASDIALLNDLYVVLEHRGSGVGRALMHASVCASQARGLRRLDWFTSPDNQRAQRLYDRTGAHRSQWIEYSLDLAPEALALGQS